jgi:hypothetical protein
LVETGPGFHPEVSAEAAGAQEGVDVQIVAKLSQSNAARDSFLSNILGRFYSSPCDS